MEAKYLIEDLEAKGIHLYRHGDKLKWRAQKGAMTNDLITMLKKHKQEFLTLINASETPPAINDKGWKSRFADSRLQFIRGDFYPWCAANLEADSIDLILTDPPYPKKYLYLWNQLGEVAARVLKPGGILATYSGLYHLPYVLDALGRHLTYCWTIALRHGGKTQLVFPRNVINTYKPILVYQKGSCKKFEKAITDTITNDRKDKKYHKWGQGEDGVKKLMEMFSDPGDLVLDPFAGGGTTLAVASAIGRRCIGIEIADSHFDIANARVRNQVLLSHRDGAIKHNPKTKPEVVAKGKKSKIDTMGRGTSIIKDDSGVEHKATTSLIISASRKTDIPAHFSKNFMDRLRRGYLKVTFPKTRYISFEDTRLIVFWTKNPQPLLGYLDEIDAMGINYYFQFTLNDYEDEGLEPNLPPLGERIETFKALSAKVGKERTIWRFDPLILTDTISPAKIVRKAGQLMKRLHPYTEKLVISFLKASKHKKVERSLTKAGIRYRDFSASEIAYIADALGRMGKQHGVPVMACSESMNLAQYGIGRNKCIDDALVRKLFGHEKDLMAFANSGKILKDTGQRPLCGCIPSLDIGTYDTCRHFCTYCYANHSEDAVENKINRISGENDLLVPDAME